MAALTLPAGEYVVRSTDPLRFGESEYSWSVNFKITEDAVTVVELSNDNAKVAAASSAPKRRVSEAAELFKTLRNGVVTIEGELAAGSGFVFDERGLVLTNHHVIEDTNDIRVRFDKKTAVRARLIAKDVERDLAVLQINLSAFADSHVLPLAKADGPE